ncbi:hypothetical protein [Mycobacterium sp. JS623]|uniref:hypothetical protein n=1 Tax=Mycobacterium sp. JS623 TaxID=212767 RepID=UPI00030DE9EB|nr:hypothetical protein [Mycobacterium sp. JS623]
MPLTPTVTKLFRSGAAGEYGDGWVPAWPMSPASYGEKRRTIGEHADRAGRPMPVCALHIA